MLEVTPQTIRNWAAAGRIPGALRCGARYLLPDESVKAMLRPAAARTGQASEDAGSNKDVASANAGSEATSEPSDFIEDSPARSSMGTGRSGGISPARKGHHE